MPNVMWHAVFSQRRGSKFLVNKSAPTVTGYPVIGDVLTGAPGTWDGAYPRSSTYQWYRSGVAISGATSLTYTVQVADENASLSFRQTITNAYGSASAESAAVGPVLKMPVDDLTTSLLRAYGLSRLRSGYTGPLFRVQRQIDNAQMDVGQGPIDFDRAAVLAFATAAGASEVRVRTLYDQSANAVHITQTTYASQAVLVSSDGTTWAGTIGNGLGVGSAPALVFDGAAVYVDATLVYTASNSAPVSLCAVAHTGSVSAQAVIGSGPGTSNVGRTYLGNRSQGVFDAGANGNVGTATAVGNQWCSIAVLQDNTTGRQMLNGNLTADKTNLARGTPGVGGIALGRTAPTGGTFFLGRATTFLIWQRVLTTQEMTNLSVEMGYRHGGIGWASPNVLAGVRPVFTSDQLDTFNTEALAEGTALWNSSPGTYAEFRTDRLNAIIGIGESFDTGQDGAPALTRTALASGVFMLGDSDLPKDYNVPWEPWNNTNFNPLVGTVQMNGSMTGDIWALPSYAFSDSYANGSCATRGESTRPMMAYQLRAMMDADTGSSNASKSIVTMGTGRSGSIFEIWLKGVQQTGGVGGLVPNGAYYYTRITSAITQIRDAAIAAGYGGLNVVAIVWNQGRNNSNKAGLGMTAPAYFPDPPHYHPLVTTKQACYDLHVQMKTDLNTDIPLITGQASPPAMFIHTVGSQYQRDEDDMGVSEGQNQFGFESGVFNFGPDHQPPDRNHLGPNGYRWIGCVQGKAMYWALHKRKRWFPMHPYEIIYRGNEIVVKCRVPVPPITSRATYDQVAVRDWASEGFRIVCDGVNQTVSSVDLSRSSIIRIICNAPFTSQPKVYYSGWDLHRGHGNICDSDATVSVGTYQFLGVAAELPGENIPALIGQTYPQNNFMVPFARLATPY